MVGNAWSAPQRPAVARSTAAGLVAALVGAIGWAVIVDVSGYKLGFAAVGIGLLVGLSMAMTAGRSHLLPVIAAALALVGGVLGDLLVDVHVLAELLGVSTVDLLGRTISHPNLLAELFKAGFRPQDAVFWAVAAAAAYRLTARGVDRVESTPVTVPVRATARPSGPEFGHGPSRPPAPAPASTTARHPSQFFNSATTKLRADAPIPLPPQSIATQLAVTIQDTVTPRPTPMPGPMPLPVPGAQPVPMPGAQPVPAPADHPQPALTAPLGPDGRPMIPAQPQQPPEQTRPAVPAAPAYRAPRRTVVARDF